MIAWLRWPLICGDRRARLGGHRTGLEAAGVNALLHAPLSAADLLGLFGHFLILSLLAVGGAITTAPDMHRYVVDQHHWLIDAQFSASIAIAQAAPGPNVLFVAAIGWNVAGPLGAPATMTRHPAALDRAHALRQPLGPAPARDARPARLHDRHDAADDRPAVRHRLGARGALRRRRPASPRRARPDRLQLRRHDAHAHQPDVAGRRSARSSADSAGSEATRAGSFVSWRRSPRHCGVASVAVGHGEQVTAICSTDQSWCEVAAKEFQAADRHPGAAGSQGHRRGVRADSAPKPRIRRPISGGAAPATRTCRPPSIGPARRLPARLPRRSARAGRCASTRRAATWSAASTPARSASAGTTERAEEEVAARAAEVLGRPARPAGTRARSRPRTRARAAPATPSSPGWCS